MSFPRVTIGLPVYNGEKYVDEAISSLRAQTYVDLRIAISDNASTDATEEICREHAREDERILYTRAERNHGSSWNYTRTFEMGVGEYFKWAAHDDVVLPTYLERLVEALDADPRAVLAQSRMAFFDERGERLGEPHSEGATVTSPSGAERFADVLFNEIDCPQVFGLIRRDVLASTGLLGPFVSHDRPLVAELALHGRFTRIDDVLFLNREHPDRSIRAYPVWREKLEWFDTSRGDKLALRHLRLLLEYHRAIRRAASGNDAWKAHLALSAWAARNAPRMARDVLFALSSDARRWRRERRAATATDAAVP